MFDIKNPFKRISLYFYFDEQGGGGGTTKTETPANQKIDLKAAVKDALTNTPIDTGKEEKQEIKTETKVEDKKEEKKDEKVIVSKQDQEDLSPEQLTFMKNLYKGLNNPDPEVQLKTLEILANAAGKKLENIKTEKTAEKVEETITDFLKKELGELDFLAEKLGPALEKVIGRMLENRTKDIREELANSKLEKQREEVTNQIADAFEEYENAVELKDDVYKLLDQFKPSSKVTAKDFFKSLIILAANSKENFTLKSKSSEETKTKIAKNRNDGMSRLSSERGADNIREINRIPQKMTLKEAITDAMEKSAELMAQGKK